MRFLRTLLLFFGLMSLPLAAQYQTPVIGDGQVNTSAYAHGANNWYMTWDATYLYIAVTNLSDAYFDGLTNAIAYLDLDPVTSGGTNANGNLNGYEYSGVTPSLPTRADVLLRFNLNEDFQYRLRDGSGGWSSAAAMTGEFEYSPNASRMEIRFPWAAMPGLSGPPAKFRWLGFLAINGASTGNPQPPANSSGANAAPALNYFFNVASTANGSSTDPFSVRDSMWTVTSNANAGAGTLREAITNANADSASERRYITFQLPGSTVITMASNFQNISQTTTIDGTTQTGGTAPAVSIKGWSSVNGNGFYVNSAGCEIRGLILSGSDAAIFVSSSSSVNIVGNYIGTNAAGTAADANYTGIELESASNCTIGGSAATERNVISGNQVAIDVSSSPTVTIENNYIGTNAAGTGSLGNSYGIVVSDGSANATIRNNVVASNATGVRVRSSSSTIAGNKIGVDASGTVALGNSTGLNIVNGDGAAIGSVAEPNVFAYNGTAVSFDGLGALVRGNSMYSNTSAGIDVTISGQPAATVDFAVVGSSALTIQFDQTSRSGSGTQSLQVDLYDADSSSSIAQGKTYRATSQCYVASSLTDQLWSPSGTFAAGNKIVLVTTGYSDTSCTTRADGSSEESGIITTTAAITTTTLGTSNSDAEVAASVDLTATISSTVSSITGSVAFTDNGNAISGCTSVTVTSDVAVCTTSFNSAASHTIVATYSGDAAHAGSTSSDFTQKVYRLFSGTGSFTSSANWSASTLPSTGERLHIGGTCTIDAATPSVAYSDMTVNSGGSIVWPTSSTTLLRVNNLISIGGSVDMTNGGTLRIDGTFPNSNISFNGGFGTVQYGGNNQTVANFSYHSLSITGSGTTTMASLAFSTNLDVAAGSTLLATGGTVGMQSSASITGSGSISFYNLSVFNGTATASTSFSVSSIFSITSGATFTPTSSSVISGSGTVSGGGTIKVTGTVTNSLSSQYSLTRDLTSLTVEYMGTSSQSVDSATYKNLTMNNVAGGTLAGDVTVSNTLTLTSGIVTGTGRKIIITNSAASAIVAGSGWIYDGTLYRAVSTGTNAYTFPVGSTSSYLPASVTFNAVTAAGQARLHLATTDGAGSNSGAGINPGRDANLQWMFNILSGTLASYDIAFNFAGATDAAASPSTFVLRRANEDGDPFFDIPATAGSTSITATGLTSTSGFFLTGNQLIHHYIVTASSSQSAGTAFTATVTAQDILNVTANDSSTAVTMTSNTGHAQFDSDGNGTFGDNSKTLTNGTFTISTKDNTVESVTLTATDSSNKTGTSSAITVNIGPASGATTTISANPTSITANGTSTSTITVQPKDVAGNNLTASGGTVTLSTDLGTLSSVTNNNNGTYTATLTGTQSGTATISGIINGSSITSTATVTLTTAPFGAPPSFVATATSTSQVNLSWAAVSGATSYQIFRATTLASGYLFLTSTSSTSYNDTGLNANSTYLYEVRAVNGSGNSAFSTVDAATTIIFTDTSISGATIRAVHISELRTAVNAMRTAAGLSAATFTDSTITAQSTRIKAVHLTELRTALDAARSTLGLSAISYSDPTITAASTTIKATHITQLRAGVQ